MEQLHEPEVGAPAEKKGGAVLKASIIATILGFVACIAGTILESLRGTVAGGFTGSPADIMLGTGLALLCLSLILWPTYFVLRFRWMAVMIAGALLSAVLIPTAILALRSARHFIDQRQEMLRKLEASS
jgi:hypothetical protein